MNAPTDPPQHIPREHFEAWQRYLRLAHLLDSAFRVPGTNLRFGLDPLLGVVPGAGDLLGAAVTGYGILLARRMGAGTALQLRMVGNVALDALAGAVPFVGDLFDFAFKANVRNRQLLERWLADPRRVERTSLLGVIAVPLVGIGLVAGIVFLAITGIRALGQRLA